MRIGVGGACGALAAMAVLALLAGKAHDTTVGTGADAVRYRLLPGSAAAPAPRLAVIPTPTPSPGVASEPSANAGIWATPAEFAPPE